MGARELHKRIRDHVQTHMRGMSLLELSRRAGVPYATLHDQMSKPKFSLQVLTGIARALDLKIDIVSLAGSSELRRSEMSGPVTGPEVREHRQSS